MNKAVCLVLAAGALSGCVTSLSEKAKLLAATQECSEMDSIAQNSELLMRYSQCVALQLKTLEAQEAAYEQRQADVLAGLSKAFEPAGR